jgi:peptide/nickel transport system permease protein
VLITAVSFVFVHVVGIPIGVLSATKQYSIRDYVATFIGFIGLAVPNFLLALVLVWAWFAWTGQVQIGLFSREYAMAPWSLARMWDLLKHLIIPAVVIGTAGTAGTIRSIRANLLDELQKTYVTVARSKGLSEARVLYKYPFRIAVNPWASTIGWLLPSLVSGEVLVSLVIGLPTLGPILLEALLAQDLFLASSIIMILSTLTVIGTLVSDIVLAWVDPRIRQSV